MISARYWRVTYHDPKLDRDISEVVPADDEVDAAWSVASGLGEHGLANCPLVSIEENFGPGVIAKDAYTRGGYRGGRSRGQVAPPAKLPSATMRNST